VEFWSFGVLIFDLEYKRWCVEPSLKCVFYFTDMGHRDLWVTVLYVVLVCWFVGLFVDVLLSFFRCFVASFAFVARLFVDDCDGSVQY